MRPGPAAVAIVLLAAAGCTAPGRVPAVPAGLPPQTAPDPVLTPGWDQTPDGEPARAGQLLSPTELTAILRLPASHPSVDTSCAPEHVRLRMYHTDAAAGHRFGHLAVENRGDRPCTLQGYPGLGARGAWGSTFQLDFEQREPLGTGDQPTPEVTLAPGATATANLEWTGELGARSGEPIEWMVIQLAAGQDPLLHPVTRDVTGDSDGGFDIGMLTTVRVGPFTG